jgi:alkylresorcinol/alkylpyrone synthase
MATITTTATAVPAHAFTQSEIAGILPDMFPLQGPELDELRASYARFAVDRRYSVLPLARFPERRPLAQSSDIYREHAVALGRRVAALGLERAGIGARDVDLLITVSCTGFIIPPLDAHLVNALGLRPDVRRLPITKLGCAGGGAALACAADYVSAHPDATALVVAVELCTLDFQPGILAPANLIATGLFGDGAAAAVVTSREGPGVKGMRVRATRSHLITGSLDEMGFDLGGDGFHLTLSKHVPEILGAEVGGPLRALLAEGQVAPEDLSFFALHPGGRRILEQVEQALGVERDRTQPAWDVLREYGNLSSAAVLFVLHEWMEKRPRAVGERGVLAAFGPGLSAELLLLEQT